MGSGRFTSREIRALQPRDVEYRLTETAPRGEGRLTLRVRPTGETTSDITEVNDRRQGLEPPSTLMGSPVIRRAAPEARNAVNTRSR
jgi:hypothetical protein